MWVEGGQVNSTLFPPELHTHPINHKPLPRPPGRSWTQPGPRCTLPSTNQPVFQPMTQSILNPDITTGANHAFRPRSPKNTNMHGPIRIPHSAGIYKKAFLKCTIPIIRKPHYKIQIVHPSSGLSIQSTIITTASPQKPLPPLPCLLSIPKQTSLVDPDTTVEG